MEKYDDKMRVIPRKCGGWLAVAHRWSDLKIGVTASTEDEARRMFVETVANWRAMLKAGPAMAE